MRLSVVGCHVVYIQTGNDSLLDFHGINDVIGEMKVPALVLEDGDQCAKWTDERPVGLVEMENGLEACATPLEEVLVGAGAVELTSHAFVAE